MTSLRPWRRRSRWESSTGRRRGRGAGLMREVEDDLVVGVAVDGGHDAADDAACFQDDLTTGARQLVVQLALERMLCLAASYLLSLTPITMSGLRWRLGGDDDLLHGRAQVRLGLAPSVKWPVDSTTICAPTSAQGSLAGSRSAQTLIFLPSTEMKSSPAVISVLQIARSSRT